MLGPSIIIGSGGQVARALRLDLEKNSSKLIQTSSSSRPGAIPLDLGSGKSIEEFFQVSDSLLSGGSAEVFLAGALTHVDLCETDRERCKAINWEGPAQVAEACAKRGHKLTFFSTEYVFGEEEYHGGSIGPFSETAVPAPTSWYGACKLEAERSIAAAMPPSDTLILRTTMVFSWEKGGNNFLMQYLRQLEEVRKGANPKMFLIPQDQVSTPTYAPSLAVGARKLREMKQSGIVNLAGSDLVSRRELLEKVAATFGYTQNEVNAGFRFLKTAEIGQKAKRPLSAGLTTAKAKELGVEVLSLAEAFNLAKAQMHCG